MKDTNGESSERGRMTFVHMEASAERDDIASSQPAGDQGTFVPNNRHLGKTGNLGEGNSDRVFDRVSESAQSGAEYDRGGWFVRGNSLGYYVSCFLSRFPSVRGIHASAPIKSSI